jgi:BirA family biotin operon repressor/biotin-[acetyl-CoA-carboxylase] ligase
MNPPFVRTLIHRDVVESTSDLAKQLAAEGRAELPLAVRADRQTTGRGRGSNTWWSDAGSLTFSLVVDPAAHGLRTEHEPRLALATAVAVIDAVTDLFSLEGLGIRWPNDVEAGGRKLGGILPERVETAHGPRLVIGIGLNVLTRLGDAPAEVRSLAASLSDFSPGPLPADALDRVFRSILERFELVLQPLASDDPGLAGRWDALDTLRDRWVHVDLGPKTIAGVGRGIDPQGALCLLRECATQRTFGGQVLRDDR